MSAAGVESCAAFASLPQPEVKIGAESPRRDFADGVDGDSAVADGEFHGAGEDGAAGLRGWSTRSGLDLVRTVMCSSGTDLAAPTSVSDSRTDGPRAMGAGDVQSGSEAPFLKDAAARTRS